MATAAAAAAATATAASASTRAPTSKQQQLRHKLIQALPPDLQRFVQRRASHTTYHETPASSSTGSRDSSSSIDSDEPAQRHPVYTFSTATMAVDTYPPQHVHDTDWRPLSDAASDCSDLHTHALALQALALQHIDIATDDDASSSSSSTHFNTLRSAPLVDAAIQQRASAGHAVAQRFVAAHELAAQAGAFVHSGLHDRALVTIRRAVLLWRNVAIAPALLNQLLQIANRRIATATASSEDLCFVFALGEVSVEQEHTLSHVDVATSTFISTKTTDKTSSTPADGASKNTFEEQHETFWRQCVALYPRVAIFRFWLAHHLVARGNVGEARTVLDAAFALEFNPQWLYLLAECLGPTATTTQRIDAYRRYIALNPPDEAFVPHAYYSLASLYLEQREYVLAKQHEVLAQLAERPPIRFPTFACVADDFAPKRRLRIAFRPPLLLLSVKQQQACVRASVFECECCGEHLLLPALLRHKIETCPQRHIGCLLCGAAMAPELLLPHQEQHHAMT